MKKSTAVKLSLVKNVLVLLTDKNVSSVNGGAVDGDVNPVVSKTR